MPRTAERIAQAEDGIAQVQTVLEHAQSALEVAGTVEAAARRSRRWLKVLLVLGVLGFGIAYLLGQRVFPMFPRRVILTGDDLLQLALIVLVISVASSVLGIWKALRVSPNEAIA